MTSEVLPAVGVVSKSRYAQHRGCSPAYVSKLIRTGALAAPALLPDGKVNVTLADQMLGPPGGGSSGTPADMLPAPVNPQQAARTERELHQARLARLKADEAEGRLLRRADVELRVFEIARRFRDELMAWPGAIAPALVRITDEREMEAALQRELENRLTRFADQLEEFQPDDAAAEEEAEAA